MTETGKYVLTNSTRLDCSKRSCLIWDYLFASFIQQIGLILGWSRSSIDSLYFLNSALNELKHFNVLD